MEQLSFFQNNPSNQRLRRSVSSVRDRVDRTVSNAKVTETSRLPHLEIPSSRSDSISKARVSLSNVKPQYLIAARRFRYQVTRIRSLIE